MLFLMHFELRVWNMIGMIKVLQDEWWSVEKAELTDCQWMQNVKLNKTEPSNSFCHFPPFISSFGSFLATLSKNVFRPFSTVLSLGFISCLPRPRWWSQICGLGQLLTSFPSFLHPWLLPSFVSSPFCLSLWPIWPQSSREEPTGQDECEGEKKMQSSMLLLSRDLRQIACLFNPARSFCQQDVPVRWWSSSVTDDIVERSNYECESCRGCN